MCKCILAHCLLLAEVMKIVRMVRVLKMLTTVMMRKRRKRRMRITRILFGLSVVVLRAGNI